MVDMVYPLTNAWANDDPMSRQNLNRMIADLLHLGKVEKALVDNDGEGDPQSVNLGEFLERYTFNTRVEVLGTTQIRIPFTADRPQTIMINGFMCQGTTDIDSSVYIGGVDVIFVIAVRTVDSTTFTIALRTSPSEGTDERLIGQVDWDGSAFDVNSAKSYELSGFGLQHEDPEILKCWVTFAGATGLIFDHHNISSVARNSDGNYTITWDTDFASTAVVVVVVPAHPTLTLFFTVVSVSISGCVIQCSNQNGAAIDSVAVYLMAIGAQ